MKASTAIALMILMTIAGCSKEQTATQPPSAKQPTAAAAPAATSRSTVVVKITGLTSIIDDVSSAASPKPKTIYLLDARKPSGGLMPHAAIVMATRRFSPTIMGTAHTLETNGSASFIRFSDGAEMLAFKEGSATGNPLTYDESDPAPGNTCPSATDSLYFVPRVSRFARTSSGAAPTAADLDPAFLSPAAKGPIAALMPIQYGSLTANVEVPVVWAFKNGSTETHRQMLAGTVEWTFTIPSNTLTLQSGGADVLQLTADATRRIELTIANAPDPDGITSLATLVPTAVQKQPVDDHFALYYDFLRDKSLKRFIPHAVGACGTSGFTNDPCQLARFVKVPGPAPTCPPAPAVVAVGELNCGPDGAP